MKDSFQKSLAVCAAAGILGSGTYVVYSGAESIASTKIVSVMEQRRMLEDKILRDSDAEVDLAETARKVLGKALGK